MKKMVSLLVAVLLCMVMVLPVAATEADFTPSVGYKEVPDVLEADIVKGDGTNVDTEPCYELLKMDADFINNIQLNTGSGMVIRDVFELSMYCQEGKEAMEEEDTFLKITFDLDLKNDDVVEVWVQVDGEWVQMEAVINDDGSLTVLFSELGPVAIAVNGEILDQDEVPQTGDDSQITVWIVVMAVAAVALVAFVIYRRNTLRG